MSRTVPHARAHLHLLLSSAAPRSAAAAWYRPAGTRAAMSSSSAGLATLKPAALLAHTVPAISAVMRWASSKQEATRQRAALLTRHREASTNWEQGLDAEKEDQGGRSSKSRKEHSRVVTEEYSTSSGGKEMLHTRLEVTEVMQVGDAGKSVKLPNTDFVASSKTVELPQSDGSQAGPRGDSSEPLAVAARGSRRAKRGVNQSSVPLQYRPLGEGPRCVAYCVAESFNFDGLLKVLQRDFVPSIHFSEVIHISVPDPETREEGDVFFFQDGSMVFWDVAQAEKDRLLNEIHPCQNGSYPRDEVMERFSESIAFTYGQHAGLLPTGELVLSISHNNNFAKAQILEKIAFSHGIQRSVKIAVTFNHKP
ncbi:hypothetical protein T484DRAFT_3262831 [Baffinella frigidus]|nr:hypothetical protein T484DRAFT_3262831 [Cryptophyta sp. CCMP2293]